MKILMLGNSLTTGSRLPELLAQLTGAEVTVHARGGARLAEHLNPKTANGARTAAALAQGGWDFVTLQEMTHAPATTPERYLEAVAALAGRARAAGAEPLVYATPAYAPGCLRYERLSMTPDELQARLQASFAEAGRATGALVGNVGKAVWEADKPALFRPDGVHLSEEGAQLAAKVLAGAMLGGRSA